MPDVYPVVVPEVVSASFSSNSTSINTRIVISVQVVDKTVYLEPELIYSGEIHSGEAD